VVYVYFLFKRYTRTDFKINTEFASNVNTTTVLGKIQDYRRNWMQYKNRMSPNRLPADQNGEATIREDCRDFWMRDSGTVK
jgi:hypothetical protein